MNLLPKLWRQHGVTMVEMIVVIVITGIIGGVVAVFIRLPAQSYVDSVARAAATDAADTTLRRISRDLRLALPNSVRRTSPAAGQVYLEFLHTTAGLRYLAEDDIIGTAPPGNYLNWNDDTKKTFDVVGGVPSGRHAPVVGNYVVVYNLGEGQEPGNAYNCGTIICNRATITAISPTTITLDSNPFPAQTSAGTPLMSPSKRFQVVTSAVTYGCDTVTGKLTRYWDYPIGVTQPTSAAVFGSGKSALLAENVKDCKFEYSNLSNQRSALVGLSLALGISGQPGASLTLEHQVHVSNTP